MVTTKRCAYGAFKNDSRYPESWVRNLNDDLVKFFHFPGAVRQMREGKVAKGYVMAVARSCVRRIDK